MICHITLIPSYLCGTGKRTIFRIQLKTLKKILKVGKKFFSPHIEGENEKHMN